MCTYPYLEARAVSEAAIIVLCLAHLLIHIQLVMREQAPLNRQQAVWNSETCKEAWARAVILPRQVDLLGTVYQAVEQGCYTQEVFLTTTKRLKHRAALKCVRLQPDHPWLVDHLLPSTALL